MPNFNEHALEMSIMELFRDQDYTYLNGEEQPSFCWSWISLKYNIKQFAFV